MMNAVIPIGPASGLVLAYSNTTSAMGALVMKVLVPLRM
jgi:hypothetical protein